MALPEGLTNTTVSMIPAAIAFSISSFSWAALSIHRCSSPSSVLQIGNGIPQKRERLRFQSLRFSNQFPKRPVPVEAGFQLMVLFNAIIWSFFSVDLINQLSNG